MGTSCHGPSGERCSTTSCLNLVVHFCTKTSSVTACSYTTLAFHAVLTSVHPAECGWPFGQPAALSHSSNGLPWSTVRMEAAAIQRNGQKGSTVCARHVYKGMQSINLSSHTKNPTDDLLYYQHWIHFGSLQSLNSLSFTLADVG